MSVGALIVGAGLMGNWHAKYARRVGAEILGVVDLDRSRATALTARFGGTVYDASSDDWLEDDAVSVVHVCSPAASHAPLVSMALKANRHVIVEKPLAWTVAETQRLLDLAQRQRRALVCVHQFPMQPGFLKLQRGVAKLGRLSSLEFTAHTAGADGLSGEPRRQVLREILPHPISLFAALGFVADGSWSVLRSTDDELELAVEQAGVQLRVRISALARPTVNELTLVGSDGSALADLYHGYSYFERNGVGQVGKLTRPFLQAGARSGAAFTNLLRRAASRESAFPGLLALLAATYDELAAGRVPVTSSSELLAAAAAMEQVAPTLD
jgi:predicted dehydrogenase